MLKSRRVGLWRDLLLALFLIVYLGIWSMSIRRWLNKESVTFAGGLQALAQLIIWADLALALSRNLMRRRAAAERSAKENTLVLAAPTDTIMSLVLLLLLTLSPVEQAVDSTGRLVLQVAVLSVMAFHSYKRLRQMAYPTYVLSEQSLRVEAEGYKPLTVAWDKCLPIWGRVRAEDWKSYAKEHDLKSEDQPKRALWLLLYRDGRRLKFVALKAWPDLINALSTRIGAPR